MKEYWKIVPEFENYAISDKGRVRNIKKNDFKETRIGRDGYERVDLYSNGERKSFRVHRLVAENFITNPDNKDFVNHIDGNKTNNNYWNLEWVTWSENMRHAYDTGLCHPFCRLYNRSNPNAGRHGKPVRIIETGEVFNSIKECEQFINGGKGHINDCLAGRQQTHHGYHFEYVDD